MRAYTSFPVDDDVVDRILVHLLDFGSLRATISISKSVHAVFRRHPHSIMRRIAFNVLGPAWPLALRVIRATESDDDDEDEDEDSQQDDMDVIKAVWSLPSPGDSLSQPLTMIEGMEMESKSHVASGLEDLFSQRYKDRSFAVSQLTGTESYRFRRAMYRFWAFSLSFSQSKVGTADPDHSPLLLRQIDFLEPISTQDLLELREFYSFFKNVIIWSITGSGSGYSTGSITLYEAYAREGPQHILECFQARKSPRQGEYADFLDPVLERIRQGRKVKDETWNKPVGEIAILESVSGKNDVCNHCHGPGGLELWSEPNWPLLGCFCGLEVLKQSLPGRLHHNHLYKTYTSQWNFLNPQSLPNVLTKMFATVGNASNENTIAGWSKDQWICTSCMKVFIGEHVVEWLKGRLIEDNVAINEDCWYGWNCRTQGKPSHADSKNHLCIPTRGDT